MQDAILKDRNKTTEGQLNNPFNHIEYSNVSHISYNSQYDKIEFSSNTDSAFVKQLLFSLDSSLTKYNFDVLICDETIVANSTDTINITIYDFSGHQDKIEKIFPDVIFLDTQIGMYKNPVSCRFILVDKNLCSICNRGISIDKRIDNGLFLEYIKKAHNKG